MTKRFIAIGCCCLASLLLLFGTAMSLDYETVTQKWSKTQNFAEEGNALELTATLFSPEYVNAVSLKEAEKNLWTKDEVEQYKYSILKVSRMDEYIPIEMSFNIIGSPLHTAPFDRHVELWINGKSYKAAEYDPRLNFKIEDSRNGMVYFPRYDEDGNDLLENANQIKLRVKPAISHALKGNTAEFVWSVDDMQGSLLEQLEGEAARKFEYDRLLKRLKNLNQKKEDIRDEMEKVETEIATIENRLSELK